MARRVTLNQLVTKLRAEVRDAPGAAFGVQVRESYENLLRRVQETLWSQYDWPHMIVEAPMALQAGQRYYDLPDDPEIPVDRVKMIYYRHGSQWLPLPRGISKPLYGINDSDLDVRSDPPRRWDYYNADSGADQIEIWPMPASNGEASTLNNYILFEGVRALSPLIASDDRADLDDQMIVMFAAAELLAARGAKDAEFKLRMAQSHFTKLRGNSVNNRPMIVMGGGGVSEPGVHNASPSARWIYDDNGVPRMVR